MSSKSLFLGLTACCLLLPALAQAENPYSNGVSFGTMYCDDQFPCASVTNRDSASSSAAAVVDMANACISKRFGMRDPNGYFESAYGVNTDLCLSSKPQEATPDGLTTVPYCCVQPVSEDSPLCRVVCTRYILK